MLTFNSTYNFSLTKILLLPFMFLQSGQLIVYLEDAKNSSNLIERDHKSLVEALIKSEFLFT